jgi:2-polyprenyl-3-methyl-5-hydroxy-6-metoxy-1,4-benzoquinol methylase
MEPLQTVFYSKLNDKYPIMYRGVLEARDVAPEMVDTLFEKCLNWLVSVHGESTLDKMTDAYAAYTMEVNISQAAYEKRGCYEFSTFAEANLRVYQHSSYMKDYYWGIFAILFCWSHYVELMEFYINRFVKKVPVGRLIEIAPGHGAWGILAASFQDELKIDGFDISPTSLEFAPKMAEGAALNDRCSYYVQDATKLSSEAGKYDAAVCSFMLEHLEQPAQFLADFAPCLKPGALAYVSLALTAAQTDHIYEFKKESEGILLAEAAGFELVETLVSRPHRVSLNARFTPRVQAMILRKL